MDRGELIDIISTIKKDSCPFKINFHCHTCFSDGSMNPKELLDQAYNSNLKYLSITDHNTIEAHKHIIKNKLLDNYPKDSLKLVSGIEISSVLNGCLVHIIGLGIDIEAKSINPYIQGEATIGDNLQAKTVSLAIKQAGGISILAHPARYRINYQILIPKAKEVGIDGIEVWYDYELKESWKASEFICENIDKLVDKYQMLKSCGTDSHGYSLKGR